MAIDIRGMAPLLQVFDMPASIKFYRDVLGFEVVSTSNPGPHFDWALLRRDGVELMLNTAYEGPARPPAPDPARVSAHGDTALFFGCPDPAPLTCTSAATASMSRSRPSRLTA